MKKFLLHKIGRTNAIDLEAEMEGDMAMVSLTPEEDPGKPTPNAPPPTPVKQHKARALALDWANRIFLWMLQSWQQTFKKELAQQQPDGKKQAKSTQGEGDD